MAVNSANARIFGSDSDSIYLAPLGTALPTSINDTLKVAFEDVGWLHSDGITEAFTGSKTEIRGHQGNRVVRLRMDTPGTTVSFHALESKAQTKALRYSESGVSVTAGVRKSTRSPGQKITSCAAVIDIFDADDVTIKERWAIPRLDIVADGDRVYGNSDIAGFPFLGEIVSDYDVWEGSAESAAVWNVTITGTPTGGDYVLTVNGFATAPLVYNATTSAVAAAINALTGVTGLGTTTISGTAAAYALTFTSSVTLSASESFTGGTTPAIAVADA